MIINHNNNFVGRYLFKINHLNYNFNRYVVSLFSIRTARQAIISLCMYISTDWII